MTPVEFQLLVTLSRLGGSVSFRNLSHQFAIGDGSTATPFMDRVVELNNAILSLRDEYIYWPDANERRQMVAENERDGLKGVILVIDGTHFPLSEAPRINPFNYSDKDKNYSIQGKIICDFKKSIRSFFTGYPGSVHDSRVYRECYISQNTELYLDNDQIIGGDKGYPILANLLTPFRENCRDGEEFGFLEEDMRRFNTFYSSKRVVIEHVNGILKEQFPALKRITIPIVNEESHQKLCRLIEACAVMYNATRAERPKNLDPPPVAGRDINSNVENHLIREPEGDANIDPDYEIQAGKVMRAGVMRWFLQKY
ncbi:unnamed protein product [Allacma fusca]|uniref:DDE Tnp4 domain-containing protein n=1 Tax=Allacma fusca TaxID=39272 RepID=A0A8J2L0F4_9HEXA|nr:unnamed protein product [Allacma fusca]